MLIREKRFDMMYPKGLSRIATATILLGVVLQFGLPATLSAQSAHPSGLRGGILVPSAQTLPRGAVGIGGYASFTRQGDTNTFLGLGSLAFGFTDNFQLNLSTSGFYTATGDDYLSFSGFQEGFAVGPVGLTFRLPGPAERSFHMAINALLIPGLTNGALPAVGHNYLYTRDSFDIGISLNQSFRAGSLSLRATEGFILTEETGTNLPNHLSLGAGFTWWATRIAGLEAEILVRPELTTEGEIADDYLAAGGGAVLNLSHWLNIRGGYLVGLSNDRSDGSNRAESWMAYLNLELLLGGGERPARPIRQRRPPPERPEVEEPQALPPPPVEPGVPDSDGDGVPDSIDEEPRTPKGATVDSVGRAIDSDGDGVPDGLDMESDTPSGAVVDSEGRAIDSDGDGVPDGIDIEAETPQGALVDADGKAVDTDHDGVPDGIDVEPDTPENIPVDAAGRGLYGMEAELITKGLLTLNTIYFNFNSANLKPESFLTLQEVGLILVKYSELKIEIGGHTDNVGGDQVNLQLSRLRAESVLNWLLGNIPELKLSQFTIVGYGENMPIATNDTVDGRTLNRRVEFKVLNPAELEKYRRKPPE